MRLNIDREPKVDKIDFFSRYRNFGEAMSKRTVIRQRGLEFDHFRIYMPGDDASLIDWKTSARVNEMMVKVYTEDVPLKILIMVDVSESMIYGTGKKAKIETAIELAINLVYGCLNCGENVGLVMYNDNIVRAVPFCSGIFHFPEFVDALTNSEKFGNKIDFYYVLNMTQQLFKDEQLIIIISDFLGYGDSLHLQLNAIFEKYDILPIVVYDKTDLAFDKPPPFYFNISDPFSRERGYLKPKKIIESYKLLNQKRVNDLINFFLSANIYLWMFDSEDSIEIKLPKLLDERNAVRK
jgi:uncharacterized protein (DUF58 family)